MTYVKSPPAAVPLRVAHVAPVILPVPPTTYGGTERVIADLIAEQVAAGHKVTLFACATSDVPCELAGGFDCLTVMERAIRERGEEPPPGLVAAIEARQLGAVLARADAFDVLHLHGGMGVTGALGHHRAKSLRTVHWRADEADHQLLFESFADQNIVAISRDQARYVPPAIHAGTVHHGIDPALYRLGTGAGGHLAFVGRMSDQKGPDVAIEIARRAGRKLLLAGDVDPGNPGFFDARVRPHLSEDIVFVGPVDDAGKQRLLGDAAALLFPIQWPEPFGLVMIEAMACGTPVIGWNRGSVAEVVDEGITGFVVEDGTAALAAIDRLGALDRTAVRERFENRFTRARMAADYETIYRDIAARSDQTVDDAFQ